MKPTITPKDILNFWFVELKPEQRFKKDEKVDNEMKLRFLEVHTQATQGELYHWRKSAEGRFAEIILLDQFSRNMYRNSKKSFQNDILALTLAQEMVELKLDQEIPQNQRAFVYMPYMHSESKLIHIQSLELYTDLGIEDNLRFEKKHKAIIDRFGRYPHRNQVLGRITTNEEEEFLKENPGF